jgi:hypothetical protein
MDKGQVGSDGDNEELDHALVSRDLKSLAPR